MGPHESDFRGPAHLVQPWSWWGLGGWEWQAGKTVVEEGAGQDQGESSLLTLLLPFLQPTSHPGLGVSGSFTDTWG